MSLPAEPQERSIHNRKAHLGDWSPGQAQEQATLSLPVQLVLAGQFYRDAARRGGEIQQLLAASVAPDQGRVGEKLRRRDVMTNDGDTTMPAPQPGRQVGSDGLQGNVRIFLKDRREGFGTEFGLDGGDVAAGISNEAPPT